MNKLKTNPSTPVLVHKTGQEGAIEIDSLTGNVLTKPIDRPEWATGVFVASFGERAGFYESRLGEKLPADLRNPEVYSFDDLQWTGVDQEQEEMTIKADQEYRMDKLAELLNIDVESGDFGALDDLVTITEAHHDHIDNPTSEQTLRDAETATDVEQVGKALSQTG